MRFSGHGGSQCYAGCAGYLALDHYLVTMLPDSIEQFALLLQFSPFLQMLTIGKQFFKMILIKTVTEQEMAMPMLLDY